MKTESILHKTDAYVLKTYGRRPLVFTSGHGVNLVTPEGAEYLDLNSGLGVNGLGHTHPVVVAAVKQQAELVYHTSNLYHIQTQSELAEAICKHSFGERVFFCNSGAESVEGALKFARKYGSLFNPAKNGIVAFKNSFHGRSYGALSATMQDKYRKNFGPFVPGFSMAEFNDISSVEKVVTDKTAAVIIEPLQGEGGVNVADQEFMNALEEICRERDILLIVDEVQCGMGRTGELFAYEQYGIEPDIMTLAKPLAGGLPIGAIVVGEKVWPHIEPGEHASTFGGNHFVTGVASAVFNIISNEDFLDKVKEKSAYFLDRLNDLKKKYNATITDVRGKGLIIGVEVTFPAIEAMQYFEENNILICIAGPQVIRFIPPLILENRHIDRAVAMLDRFLKERQ